MKAYMIHCSTGCTCCSNENHYCGPFSSREIAEGFKARFHATKRLASQYAPNGHYKVEEYDTEVLPDGRIIISSRVFPGWADQSGWEEIDSDLFARG